MHKLPLPSSLLQSTMHHIQEWLLFIHIHLRSQEYHNGRDLQRALHTHSSILPEFDLFFEIDALQVHWSHESDLPHILHPNY